MLADGLRALCKRTGVSAAPGLEAISRTAQTQFRHQRTLLKLRKSNPSRRVRAEVMITHRRGGTDVSLRLTHRATGLVSEEPLVSGQYWPSIWFDFFRSRWEGPDFVVTDRVGKETFRKRCAA